MAPKSAQRKPVSLHLYDGKKHLTKKEIEERKESEITMGKLSFSAPLEVRKNKDAHKKWKEVTKIYREAGLDFVSSTDNGVIGRYCIAYSEYLNLIEIREDLSSFNMPLWVAKEYDSLTKQEYTTKQANYIWSLIQYSTSVQALLKLDSAINAKFKTILDLEDRIFLNPAAKVRTLPLKKKSKKKDPVKGMGFNV